MHPCPVVIVRFQVRTNVTMRVLPCLATGVGGRGGTGARSAVRRIVKLHCCGFLRLREPSDSPRPRGVPGLRLRDDVQGKYRLRSLHGKKKRGSYHDEKFIQYTFYDTSLL